MEFTHDETVKMMIEWSLDKKAEDIRHYDVRGKSDYTDSIIVCHGTADLHAKAIADHIIIKAKENKIHLLASEGRDTGSWILLDFADIIIHIFNEETRQYYKIEDLWSITPEKKKEMTHDKEQDL